MSVDEIGDKLAIVLGEIGNAFHTTTVALAAAISMMFSLYLCERTERGIVRRINRRVDRELLSRFEVVDEKLTPFINAVEVGQSCQPRGAWTNRSIGNCKSGRAHSTVCSTRTNKNCNRTPSFGSNRC